MNVHEYQAKALLRSFGVAVPEGMFMAKAVACFVFGGVIALPLLLWAGLLDRGGAPTRNQGLWWSSAAVAALAANLGLQLHCPITDRAHLLASHATVGVALIVLVLCVGLARRSPLPA